MKKYLLYVLILIIITPMVLNSQSTPQLEWLEVEMKDSCFDSNENSFIFVFKVKWYGGTSEYLNTTHIIYDVFNGFQYDYDFGNEIQNVIADENNTFVLTISDLYIPEKRYNDRIISFEFDMYSETYGAHTVGNYLARITVPKNSYQETITIQENHQIVINGDELLIGIGFIFVILCTLLIIVQISIMVLERYRK
jgi:hypothetical protein